MEYNKIIAVAGLPGLYELLSSKSDGAIVRSLDDKTTRFVSSRIHNFSHLESIEVYTVRDNVNLAEILKAMEASKEKLPDDKDPKALKNYFTKVYPDLDFSRVYSSDLKKMIKWFAVLKANNIEVELSEPEEASEEAEDESKEAQGSDAGEATTKAAQKKTEAKATASEKPAAAKKAEGPEKKAAAAKSAERPAEKADKPAAAKKAEAPAGKKPASAPKTEKKAAAKPEPKSKTAKTEKDKKASSKSTDKPGKTAKKK